jgi:Zn-dependent M28 family amino/carboxypeptidase
VFTNVVNAYGLSSYLTPAIVADGESRSDHSSFWNRGYSAILAIEDWNDFDDYYHTSNDRLQTLDMAYFTNFVKASVGTAAHLAHPVEVTGILTGVVSDAVTFSPIAGAQVKSALCPMYTETSDAQGVYTLTLPVGIYSITASATGYWPKTIGGVTVTSTTTRDIPLAPVRTTYMPLVFKDAP